MFAMAKTPGTPGTLGNPDTPGTPGTRSILTGLTAAAAVALAAIASPMLAEDVAAAPTVTATLDQAAGDAEIVIVIPSLSGLSEAVAAFATETGLDQLAPEFDDGLGAFKQQMGWLEGVDDEGAMLVVVSGLAESIEATMKEGAQIVPDNAADIPNPSEPTAIMLVPVSDYQAFVAQLGGDAGADATAVTYQNLDGYQSDGYAKELNGYAVMGDSLETVQAYAAGDQGKAMAQALSPIVTDYLNGGDALIYLDMAALAPSFNLAIDKAVEEISREMNDPDNGMPAGMDGMLTSMMNLYEQSGRLLVDGTDKLLLSMDFGDDGLGMTVSSKLTGDSELASFFAPAADAEGGSTSGPLLASLPDQPYIFASSVDATRFGLTALVETITDAMGDGNEAGFMAMYQESLAIMKDVKGVASVFYAPEPAAMMAGGFYTSLTVYDVADADAYLASQKASLEKLSEIKVALPAMEQGQPASEMTFTTTYTEKALVIDGTDVHQFQINTILPPEMMQQFGPMAALMGNAGTGGYIAAKDGKVIVSTVTDPQLITRGLQALGNDDGVGSAGTIATLRENNLPEDSSMEVYISLAGIAKTANPFLLMFLPGGGQVEIPADLPPLAMGGASDGEGVAMRMFVPHALVDFGIKTYNQFAPAAEDDGPRDGTRRRPRAY